MSTLYVDNLEPNLGSRVLAAGHVVQVVQATHTTQTELTTTATWTDVASSATITPTSTSSKILIMHSAGGMVLPTASTSIGMRFLRDSTNIASRARQAFFNASTDYMGMQWEMTYLDSPATTSEITYKVQIYLENAGNVRHNSSDSNISPTTSISSTTLMEIAQ